VEELIESTKVFAKREIPKYQSEHFYNSIPKQLWRSMAEQGLTGINISESFGGIGVTPSISAEIYREISRVDLGPAIFLSVHSMVAGIIERFGSESQKSYYLPKLASGEYLGAFALTEPGAGSDAASLKTKAEKKEGYYVLNGEKCYITSGGFADVYVVFAKVDDKISAFLVDGNAKGLTISSPEKKMGCELSPIASLSFENLQTKNQLEGDGYKIALSGLAGGRINIAACANGVSECAIELSKAFLSERSQFGEKLKNFQGLQFIFADMVMLLEASKAITEKAARELTEKGDSRLLASASKCFATDSCMKITTDAVQLLGGAGYIKEYHVEKLMRDAKMLQIVEGTNQIQRMLIARNAFAS
jgi:alkylation response protein AidB-like acyl-CoA dehydrogenase